MKRFTRHLLICTAIAATLFTATVSAANSSYYLEVPNGSSLKTGYVTKDDSEGKAYITPTYAEASRDKGSRAWVVDASGKQISDSVNLEDGKKVTSRYYAGYNIAGSEYRLKVTYVANPMYYPMTGLEKGVWCP